MSDTNVMRVHICEAGSVFNLQDEINSTLVRLHNLDDVINDSISIHFSAIANGGSTYTYERYQAYIVYLIDTA